MRWALLIFLLCTGGISRASDKPLPCQKEKAVVIRGDVVPCTNFTAPTLEDLRSRESLDDMFFINKATLEVAKRLTDRSVFNAREFPKILLEMKKRMDKLCERYQCQDAEKQK